MLDVRPLSKQFTGHLTGYLGPNGSGKSTTINIITGLMTATSGEVWFDGAPIARDPVAWKHRFGYVPEEPHFYVHLSGREYLTTVGQLRRLPAAVMWERLNGLLRLLGLDESRHIAMSGLLERDAAESAARRGAGAQPGPAAG